MILERLSLLSLQRPHHGGRRLTVALADLPHAHFGVESLHRFRLDSLTQFVWINIFGRDALSYEMGMKARIRTLLEKHRAEPLVLTEAEEFDEYDCIDNLVSLLKTPAFQSLRAPPLPAAAIRSSP